MSTKENEEIIVNGKTYVKKNNNSGGGGCSAVIIAIIFIIVSAFAGIKGCVKNATGNLDGYIITSGKYPYYDEMESNPKGLEKGFLPKLTTVKINSYKTLENVTWVNCFTLIDNKAVRKYLLIPSHIKKIFEKNSCFEYCEISPVWEKYYKSINARNSILLSEYKNKLSLSIIKLDIKKTNDNIEKESLKSGYEKIKKDSYFGLFDNDDNYDFYIKNSDIKYLNDAFKSLNKEYLVRKIEYFE